MEDKKQYRRFFTDTKYQESIEKTAQWELARQKEDAAKPVKNFDPDDSQKEWYHPAVDRADVVALAIKSELNGRSGVDLDFDDPELGQEVSDTIAEIVRQGMASEVYERPAIEHTPPFVYHDEKWPYFDDNEIRSSGETYTPHEVRQQLFDRMLDKAIFHGTHGDFTPVERCVQTVRSVIDVINGGDGNRPDGKGLPLFQLMISPHPEYLEERARQGLPDYDNSVPVDYGLPSPEYQTGLTRAFEDHFDTRFAGAIKDRSIRAAKDLFGGE
jgi:hypothetical protein